MRDFLPISRMAVGIFLRSLRARAAGFRKYPGSPSDICRAIVNERWNGRCFEAGGGNFRSFWSRDFGICVDSLLALGYRRQVLATLSHALSSFSRHGRVATTILDGVPFDAPYFSADSLPFLVRSLARARAHSLVKEHKPFLEAEASRYFRTVIEPDSGLVRRDRYFNLMRDQHLLVSPCYSNCMAGMLQAGLKELGLRAPAAFPYRRIIKDAFWNGEYFHEELGGNTHVSGDANLFPYWCGLFPSRSMLRSSVGAMRAAGLDRPLPLRYVSQRRSTEKTIAFEFLVRDYECGTAWMHMGPLYIQAVRRIDKALASEYVQQYAALVSRYRTFPEVLNPDGTPFHTPFYYCDEGMLWAANLLALLQ